MIKCDPRNGFRDGIVVLALNTNESIKRIKGESKIIFSDMERYSIFNSIKGVDLVVFFNEDTPIDLIKAIKPHFLVKGSDYKIENVIGKEYSKVVLAPYDDRYSTTKIFEKIKQK